jgi:two-component system, cell cycle sensor histidine kinase and response regulator CckA
MMQQSVHEAAVWDERQQLLGELAELLDRLAALQDAAPSHDQVIAFDTVPGLDPPMTWTTDGQLRFTAAVGSLAGGTAEGVNPLLDRTLSEFLASDDPDHPIIRCHLRALAGQTVFYRSRWGERLWFNHLAPVRNPAGKVVGTIGCSFEVGAAGDDWAARSASARRHRVVVSSAPVGVAVLSLDGQVLECNPALARILDYSPQEVRSRGVAGLSHPDDLMLDVPLFTELVEGKRDSYQIEKRYFRRDGSLVWCNLTVSLVRSAQNAPEFVIAIIEDVTERRQAVEALRESEAKLRSLYESDMLGIVFFSHGHISDANDAFLAMVGYQREDLGAGSLHWDALTAPEFAGRDAQSDAELAVRGTFTPFEKDLIRKDGSRIPVLVGGARFEGQEERGAVFVLDVSEKRRLEAQFQHAKHLEVLGRLAGGIAHDFNNMLTSVIGNADLAMKTLGPNHPAHVELMEIEKAGLRAAELTRQLLAFSCKQVMLPKVFFIDDLIRRFETMLRRVIREDVTLITDLGAAGARVKADSGQIERVLMNLVLNARDAMTKPGRIVIRTRRLGRADPRGLRSEAPLNGPCVAISVKDNGKGMDADTVGHVFEPFFTTKGPGQGTGLGLSIVYGVVQQSGGGIRVESQPGCGTLFEVLLPESQAPLSEIVPPPSPATSRGHETILIAEDDPLVLDATSRILTHEGYTVIATNSPAAALPASEQHRGPIHLLVSDLVMPGMSGVDLADRIHRVHPEAKVLYMSGYASSAIQEQTQASKFEVAVLNKPFLPNELALRVREILEAPMRPATTPPADRH